MASTPRVSGSISPVPTSAPSAVPVTQVTYWAALAPNITWRSKAPSVWRARIHDGSTSGWPWSARLSAPPGRYGASATPIGRKRLFTSVAASSAVPSPPPVA